MKKSNSGFFQAVYNVVEHIPVGKVTTYGDIAKALGCPHASQAVGFALHANPKPFIIPCHRVVNRFGELSKAFAFDGIQMQAKLLMDENVEVSEDYKVDLDKYRWIPQ